LKAIFYDRLDYISKYDFYGSLAQAALDHLDKHKGNTVMRDLLLDVLGMAKKYKT
jgi:hypothetical protein